MSEEIKISVLNFPECVRKRPSMYFGDVTDKDLSCSIALREPVDNSIDEAVSGYGRRIEISLAKKDSDFYSVLDHARGVPLTFNSKEGDIAAHLIFSRLHSSSKFDETKIGQAGLNGVGASCTNALSSEFEVYVNAAKILKEGREVHKSILKVIKKKPIYLFKYAKGVWVESKGLSFPEAKSLTGLNLEKSFGTLVRFLPDPSIWDHPRIKNLDTTRYQIATYMFDQSLIREGLTDLQRSKKSLDIIIDGEKVEPVSVRSLFKENLALDKLFKVQGEFSSDSTDVRYTIEFGYADKVFSTKSKGSSNGLETHSGIHINAAMDSISSIVSQSTKSGRGRPSLSPSNALSGLRVFVLLETNEASYSGQTKESLKSILRVSRKKLAEHMTNSIQSQMSRRGGKDLRDYIQSVASLLKEYHKGTASLSLQEEIKSKIGNSSDNPNACKIGTKVYEAKNAGKNKHDTELFITEGQSASLGLVKTRDKHNQAILPLRGKVLNVAGMPLEKAIKNHEISSMFALLGCGIEGVNFNIEDLRYSRIILAADADADGYHITALMLAPFMMYAPNLIEEGRVYIASTPLYIQDGTYFYTEEGLDKSKKFSRKKGLGSLSDEETRKALLSKDRVLTQVTIEGYEEAIKILSGETRKQFLTDRGVI